MAKYFFIGTMLPSLSFDSPLEISFTELEMLLHDNLTRHDYKKIIAIRRFFDVLNLRSLWLGEEFDQKGYYSSQDLEEAFVNQVGLPDYVYEFVDKYPKKEDRIHHFSYLLSKFFLSFKELRDPFLRKYLLFERELRLIMTSFRAKKLKRDLVVELRYENPEEEFIAQLFRQKDAKMDEPSETFQDIKVIFEKNETDPLNLQKEVDRYRFEKIDQFAHMAEPFSIEPILAYFLQFIIVEKWFQLDQAKGNLIIDKLLNE